MELLLGIAVVVCLLGYLAEKITELLKQLKSGSAKLNKGFEATLSVVPIDKKSEDAINKHPHN